MDGSERSLLVADRDGLSHLLDLVDSYAAAELVGENDAFGEQCGLHCDVRGIDPGLVGQDAANVAVPLKLVVVVQIQFGMNQGFLQAIGICESAVKLCREELVVFIHSVVSQSGLLKVAAAHDLAAFRNSHRAAGLVNVCELQAAEGTCDEAAADIFHMDRPVFIDVHADVALETSHTYAEVLNGSGAVCDLVNSGMCPISGALEAVNALQLGHAQDIEHLSQVIDAEVEQRSVNADLGIDEIAAEERHIIAGTALTSVAYASYVIDLTELAFSDHLLGDTGLRVVDGADLDRQLLAVLLLCVIEDLGICIACCHGLLGIAREACCHNCSCNRCVKVVVYADLDFVDVISLEHFTEVLIQVLFCDAILLAPCKEFVFVDLSSSDNLEVLSALVEVLNNGHVSVGNHSAADDGDSEFFHDGSFPEISLNVSKYCLILIRHADRFKIHAFRLNFSLSRHSLLVVSDFLITSRGS